MDSAWESWIRPVVLIVVAGTLGALWYFNVIPDAVVGGALGVAVLVGAVGAVWHQVRHAAPGSTLKRLGLVVITAATLVALWSPWVLLGPGGEIAGADITEGAPALAIPATGGGPDPYRVYFHGTPAYWSSTASVNLALDGKPGTLRATRLGRLDTQTAQGQGQGGGREVKRRDLVWPVVADLSVGGQVIVHESEPGTLSWPAHVEVHHAPPAPALPLAAGGAVLLFALVVEATNKRRQRSWISTFAAASPLATILFGAWYAPGHLTATVFGAALVSAIGGTVVSYSLLPLFRMRLAPPAEQPVEA